MTALRPHTPSTRPAVCRPPPAPAPRSSLAATGLRNQWHPVLPSRLRRGRRDEGISRLGEDWLLFRRADGPLRMLEDRCPHRGAPLSQGVILGDRLACPYHGVEVAAPARSPPCPASPAASSKASMPVAALPRRGGRAARSSLLRQRRAPRAAAPLELPEQLTDDDVSAVPLLHRVEGRLPLRARQRDGPDARHLPAQQSHSHGRGQTTAKFRIRETDLGFFFEKTGQRGVNFDWVEFCRTGMRLDATWPSRTRRPPAPAAPSASSAWPRPIDAERTAVFFWRYRRVAGWQRDIWRFLYRTALEARHWDVLEQDRVMLEAMAPRRRPAREPVPARPRRRPRCAACTGPKPRPRRRRTPPAEPPRTPRCPDRRTGSITEPVRRSRFTHRPGGATPSACGRSSASGDRGQSCHRATPSGPTPPRPPRPPPRARTAPASPTTAPTAGTPRSRAPPASAARSPDAQRTTRRSSTDPRPSAANAPPDGPADPAPAESARPSPACRSATSHRPN